MVRYHAVTRNDCQSHAPYILELSDPRSNRTNEPLQHIAFYIDFAQRNNVVLIKGPMQTAALGQDIYGVWVYNPQSKNKS